MENNNNNYNKDFHQIPVGPEVSQIVKLPSAQVKKPNILKSIIVIVAIISVIGICIAIFGGGKVGGKKEVEKKSDKECAQEAIEMYLDARYKGAFDKIERCLPDFIWEYHCEKNGSYYGAENAQELVKIIQESYSRYYQEEYLNEFGEFVRYDYDIISCEEIDEDTLNRLTDGLVNDSGSKKVIKKGYKMEVDVEIEFEEGSFTINESYYIVKIDGEWYVLSGSGGYYGYAGSEFLRYYDYH